LPSAAAPPLAWQHQLGGAADDVFNSVATAPDGHVFAAGYTASDDGPLARAYKVDGGEDPLTDAVIASFAPDGALDWARAYGGSGSDSFGSLVVAANGDIVAVGRTNSTGGDFASGFTPGHTALVVRLTAAGQIIWAKTFGGSKSTWFDAAAVAPDGGIVAVGTTFSTDGDFPSDNPGPNGAPVVAKITASGSLAWAKVFDDATSLSSVSVAGDGSIVACGSVASGGDSAFADPNGAAASSTGAVVAKLSPDGSVMWARTYGGSGYDGFNSVGTLADGSIAVVGGTTSPDGDFPSMAADSDAPSIVVSELDASGSIKWAKVYGNGNVSSLNALALGADDELIATGWVDRTVGAVSTATGQGQAVIIAFDDAGNMTWAAPIGNTGDYQPSSVAVTADNNVVVVGTTTLVDRNLSRGGHTNMYDAAIVELGARKP